MTLQKTNTIDGLLSNLKLTDKGIEINELAESIAIIKKATTKIPLNGEYDPNIISNCIGIFVVGMQECGKLLASLGLVEAYQETQVEKEQAMAALERADKLGYKTAAEKKLYSQLDDKYIEEKNKLSEIQAAIKYIENYRSSLDKAHLHCKKIIDRGRLEERFANDHEKFSINDNEKWIDENNLK